MATAPKTEIDSLVKDLRDENQPKRHAARQHLRNLCWSAGAPGQEKERARLAQGLAEALAERQSPYATQSLCELVGLVGDVNSVPKLAPLLEAKETRDPALSAIAFIQGADASAAIIKAARSESDAEFRISAINKLATRGDEAKSALLSMIGDSRAEIRLTVAEALASFADHSLDEKITVAAPHASPRDAARIASARLTLASNLAKAGKAEAAAEIRTSVAESESPEPQKQAARRSLESAK